VESRALLHTAERLGSWGPIGAGEAVVAEGPTFAAGSALAASGFRPGSVAAVAAIAAVDSWD
jgi:hypothetical protein